MNASSAVDLVPLDLWDEVFHSLYGQHDGAGTGAVVLHMRGRIGAEPLRSALAALQLRHPKLRARIEKSSSGRHGFRILGSPPPIPFEIKDLDTEDLPWKEESSRLMGVPLDSATGPLARVVVLRGLTRDRPVLILMAHHAIGDGQSMIRLTDDLLGYYGDAEEGVSPIPVAPLSIPVSPRAKISGNPLKRALVIARLYQRRRENRKAN